MGNIVTELAQRLLALATQQQYRVTFFLLYPPQIPHDTARNLIVKQFLEHKEFTHLLQIDSDVVPPSNILEMVENDVDICSAVCFVWNGEEIVPTAALQQYDEHGKRTRPKGARLSDGDKDLQEVDFIGGGCVMMKRSALETIRASGKSAYAFDYDQDGIMWQGEDYHFSQVARDCGLRIHVDRRFICGHYKSVDFAWLNRLIHTYWKAGDNTLLPEQHGNGNSDGGTNARKGPPTSGGAAG